MTGKTLLPANGRRFLGWSLALGAGAAGFLGAWLMGPSGASPGSRGCEAARPSASPPAGLAAGETKGSTSPAFTWCDALNEIREEGDPNRQEQRIEQLVRSLSLDEIPGVLARFSSDAKRLEWELASRCLRRWAREAPRTAVTFAVNLAAGPYRRMLLQQAALGWTEGDWTESSDWAQGMENDPDKNAVLRVVAEEVLRKSPVESLLLALQMTPGPDRREVTQRAVMEWTSLDPDAALAWAQRVPDTSLRSDLLASIAVAWADQNAPAAAGLALRELPPGRNQEDAVLGILNRWAQTDSEGAANWVDTLPSGLLKQTARSSVFGIWSAAQPARAKRWFMEEASTLSP